ncbi:MAG: HEAT repeat domain-containing protein [Calditrichota bacterium]|jgi:HEAT repeat protein
MSDFNQNDWKEILARLSSIREQEDYSTANVDFIIEQLQSEDDRIRGGAALTAEGCVFEPNVVDLLLEIIQNDQEDAVRKASIQSLGQLIHEGVLNDFEAELDDDENIEFYEEWDEIQAKTLQADYRRAKYALLSLLQNEFENREVREASLMVMADLGSQEAIREWIDDFIHSEYPSSQLVALNAMGKFPHYWIKNLSEFLTMQTPKAMLMEAISSSYSSGSSELAVRIENLLSHHDPDILSYAILALANINQTPELGSILQSFSLHENEIVRKAAREAIKNFSAQNFSSYLENELGFEE